MDTNINTQTDALLNHTLSTLLSAPLSAVRRHSNIISFVSGAASATIVYLLYNKYLSVYSKKKCSKRRRHARHPQPQEKFVKPVENALQEKTELSGKLEQPVLQADLPNVSTVAEEQTLKGDIFNAILMMADQKQSN